MEIAIGITLLVAVIGFSIYSGICIKHAARFRYLSARTVYLSLGFVGMSVLTITAIFATYLWMVLN
jgi:hypothetical protein